MDVTEQISTELVTVLLPARNEADTIRHCVETYKTHPSVGEVLVVANGCEDSTAILARQSGAIIIESEKFGKGLAIKLGAAAARYPVVVCIDADTPSPCVETVNHLLRGNPSSTRLVKGTFDREGHPGPVTDMLVKPMLEAVSHPLRRLSQPLSGVFAVGTKWLSGLDLPLDFGVDLHLIFKAERSGLEIVEVDIGTFIHRKREWNHYRSMARTIVSVLQAHALVLPSYEITSAGRS